MLSVRVASRSLRSGFVVYGNDPLVEDRISGRPLDVEHLADLCHRDPTWGSVLKMVVKIYQLVVRPARHGGVRIP